MVEYKNYYRSMIKKKIHWLMKKTLQQVNNLKKLQYDDNLSSSPRARIVLPYLLNQVCLESCMCVRVANLAWPLKVCIIAWMVGVVKNRLRDSSLHEVIVKCKLVVVPLVLNNHVMEYHTCSHNNIDFFLIHHTCRATTMVNRACNTPKARSMSFLTDSWCSAKNFSWGLGEVRYF